MNDTYVSVKFGENRLNGSKLGVLFKIQDGCPLHWRIQGDESHVALHVHALHNSKIHRNTILKNLLSFSSNVLKLTYCIVQLNCLRGGRG